MTKGQLAMGVETEEEHHVTYKWFIGEMKAGRTPPPPEDFYKRIALDHLKEYKMYYTYLDAMEELLENTL